MIIRIYLNPGMSADTGEIRKIVEETTGRSCDIRTTVQPSGFRKNENAN